jgi:iron-sulfur cluster assembly protein
MSEAQATTQPPVDLTDEAVERVRRLIEKDGREGIRLRLGVRGGGCSGLEYVLKLDDTKTPYDVEYEIKGIPVVVDAKSALHLQGSILEYTTQLISGGFRIKNPNAGRTCGCGTSFTPNQ